MPGKSANHNSTHFDVVYTINSLGARDKPRHISKDENVYRILLYGDSQVFGWGVPQDKRFSDLIENRKKGLEIWNLAVPGYGLDQEILSYERHGKSFVADEVMFFVSWKTLQRTGRDYIFKKHKPTLVMNRSGALKLIPVPEEKTAWTAFFYRIFSGTYLPYFLERRFYMFKDISIISGYNKGPGIKAESLISPERLSEFEERILLMARTIALGRNQKITILAELPKYKRRYLRDFCDQNVIGFLQIVFDAYKEEQLTLGRHDRHWNSDANRLVAEQLMRQM